MAKIPRVQLRPKILSYHKGDNVYDQTQLLWLAVDLLKRPVDRGLLPLPISIFVTPKYRRYRHNVDIAYCSTLWPTHMFHLSPEK